VDLAGKTAGEGASNELFTGKASKEILDDGYCRVVTEVFATEGIVCHARLFCLVGEAMRAFLMAVVQEPHFIENRPFPCPL